MSLDADHSLNSPRATTTADPPTSTRSSRSGPSWWVDLVERVGQPAWEYGASLPSFAAAFGLGVLAVLLERRGVPARLRLG